MPSNRGVACIKRGEVNVQSIQFPVINYNCQLMQCIPRDKVKIAKAVNVTTITLDQAPNGYKDFDHGAVTNLVINSHEMIAA